MLLQDFPDAVRGYLTKVIVLSDDQRGQLYQMYVGAVCRDEVTFKRQTLAFINDLIFLDRKVRDTAV